MANDIDKTSPHYKGEFGSIYEVNQKFPSGGVEGDYVAIDGWAHYWNADRGTWCVNAQRDSYWDELITNIIEHFKTIKGASYMGVATTDTVPDTTAAKMFYFALQGGKYANFGNQDVAQGINVLLTEDGKSWTVQSLISVAQELGASTTMLVSQKAITDAINRKANTTDVDEALSKKADKETMNAELAKKFDKVSVVQETGTATDKVMSQKVVTDNLTELQNTVFPLEVSLSLDKPLLEYTGSEQSIKATYSIKRKGSPITPTALALSVDGSLISIDVKQADTVTIKVNKEGETQIILTAKHGDLVKSATNKVTMVLPIYYGFGTTETDIAIAANKLSPRLSASGTYAKTSAKDDVNFIILAPKTLEGLSSFTMGGAPFVMETSSVSINGKDYYMYKSGGVYMSGTTLRVLAG
ncbi:hypothetical protein [Segatella copri]|uniref:Uncharacterized protein n=1 Tax=Segatella copri TaxID=165179 RepID=A0AA90UUS6_9BACT|nr:hypothetical protein [Segatella copri]MQN82716.1 hypothetical protein [Segatella copri]